jgi:hypothetical protein
VTTKGAGRAPRRARHATFAVLGGLAALSLGGCGEEDFANEPARASAAINVAARVDQREVVVSPNRFGAGLVNFTVANFADSPVTFTLSGPKDAATEEIPAGAAADLKIDLPQGSYEASAGEGASAKPDTVRVGPTRPGSENELLEP